jgi:hypothetical protein
MKRLYPLIKDAISRFNEEQTIALGGALYDVATTTAMRSIISEMRHRWPETPELLLLSYDIRCDGSFGYGPISDLLDRAATLAAELPRERQQRILDEIRTRRAGIPEISNLAEMMLEFMEREGIDL